MAGEAAAGYENRATRWVCAGHVGASGGHANRQQRARSADRNGYTGERTWLAEQVAGGLAHVNVEARFAGMITTPGVAYLTRTGPFVAGVMISASHNPYHGQRAEGHQPLRLQTG